MRAIIGPFALRSPAAFEPSRFTSGSIPQITEHRVSDGLRYLKRESLQPRSFLDPGQSNSCMVFGFSRRIFWRNGSNLLSSRPLPRPRWGKWISRSDWPYWPNRDYWTDRCYRSNWCHWTDRSNRLNWLSRPNWTDGRNWPDWVHWTFWTCRS